ncbi:MAG: urease accessory protein UreF [Betaproteobacteria bacterium]|nr:urease accessory protein UreF [Betaproteobacteria bacterium]
MNPLVLIRLLHLASPALPVGAYSYSQGLEWAVESGVVRDEAGAGEWIADALQWNLAQWEAPLVGRLVELWSDSVADTKGDAVVALNAGFLAARETAELRAETVQMGYSCLKVLPELFNALPHCPPLATTGLALLATLGEPAFPTVWSCAAAVSGASAESAVTAYLWAWLENQVMGAIKLVPLGQSAGQRLLARLSEKIPDLSRTACRLPESEWHNFAPGLVLASSRHETQYSRLFRS